MSELQAHVPQRDCLSTEELKEMASLLNAELKRERSRISTRERARLDRIADGKQLCKSGYTLLHSKFVQLVERSGDRLFLGNEELSESELLERSLTQHFEVNYFSYQTLNAEFADFCSLLCAFAEAAKAPVASPDLEQPKHSAPRNPDPPLINFIVTQLAGIYKRVFNLHPYLGGVSALSKDRNPHSPFAIFSLFIFKNLGILGRSGSHYGTNTLKNAMPKGGLRSSIADDEDELVAARLELEFENEASTGKRKRGRPRKAVSLDVARLNEAKSTPDAK